MDTDTVIEFIRRETETKYLPVMRPDTCALLTRVAEKIRPKEVLEIGTCVGVSGLVVLSATDAHLTTVDIDGEAQEEARKNFAKCGFSDRVTMICDDCFAAADYVSENRYDLIVLDGPKGHYKELYLRLKKTLNAGGVLFCDDVDFHGLTDGKDYPDHKHRTIVYGMRDFIKTISSDPDFTVERYETEDGVLVATLS